MQAAIRQKVELGKFRSLVVIDSRGRMLTPEVRLHQLEAEYDGEILFLRYTDSNYFG